MQRCLLIVRHALSVYKWSKWSSCHSHFTSNPIFNLNTAVSQCSLCSWHGHVTPATLLFHVALCTCQPHLLFVGAQAYYNCIWVTYNPQSSQSKLVLGYLVDWQLVLSHFKLLQQPQPSFINIFSRLLARAHFIMHSWLSDFTNSVVLGESISHSSSNNVSSTIICTKLFILQVIGCLGMRWVLAGNKADHMTLNGIGTSTLSGSHVMLIIF